jgi:hypothetical protein
MRVGFIGLGTMGLDAEDMSAVIKCYEEWAGITVEKIER